MYLSHFEIYFGYLMTQFLNMNFVDTNVVLQYGQTDSPRGWWETWQVSALET